MSIAKHTTFNLLGTIVPLAVSVVTIPFYLNIIGAERFGVLSICWLLLGYMGLFDLGLGRAVSQKMAVLVNSSPEARSNVFWAGLFISAALAALATAAMTFIAEPTLRLMKFQDDLVVSEISAAAPWLVAALPISLVSGIFSGALIGRERFGFLNVIEVISNSLTLLAPLGLAVFVGTNLSVLIAGTLAAKAVGAVCMASACVRSVPLRSPTLPDAALSRDLLSYGGWVTVSSLIGPILAYWDRLVVGWMIGAAAVSVYVIPFILVSRLVTLPGALSRALFPRFAASSAVDNSAMQATGLILLSVLLTPGALLVMLLANPFLRIWVGQDIGDQSAQVAYILLPGMWMNGVAQVAFTLLQAQGRPNIVAKVHMAEVLPYMAFLYLGLKFFGIEGAAFAWSLRATADAILLFWHSDPGLRGLKRLFPCWCVIVAGSIAGLMAPAASPVGFVLLAGTLMVGTGMALAIVPPELRKIVLGKLFRPFGAT